MCKTLAEGGKRCAAHTRPRYEAATFGTPEWDRAAADYAATPSGRKALTAAQHEAEQDGDVERAVAFTHALREGERLASAANAVRDALTIPSLSQRLAPVEDSLRTMAEELGYRRTLVRPNSDAKFIGTFVFQQGTHSTEVPYAVHAEGLTVRLRSCDVTPDHEVSPLVDQEFRAHWDDGAALAGLTNQVRTVLEHRRDPDATGAEVLTPATVDELESAFTALGHDLGYTKVRITDVPDGLSRYVDFLRRRPAKSRRIRYYAHPDGWSVRIGGYYPRLARLPQARQGERDLTVSAAWNNETDSAEALNIVRDLFAALD